MFDTIKKSMLTGIGLALKTRDEVEDFAKDWTEKQRLNEEEGRKFMDDLLKRYDTSVEKLEDKIRDMVGDALKKANIATREELDSLKKEVDRLRQAMKPGEDE